MYGVAKLKYKFIIPKLRSLILKPLVVILLAIVEAQGVQDSFVNLTPLEYWSHIRLFILKMMN